MLLKIDRMTVRYGSKVALDIDRPIIIEEKDRLGVIGSNGAGKSTLIRSLIGLKKYDGHVERKVAPSRCAVQMQFNNYNEGVSCRTIMERILDMDISSSKDLTELIDYYEFGDCLDKKYQSLSGGQKQRFTIILVMMQQSPLTFYDEITSGLDFETRTALMSKLEDWYEKRDDAFVIVSHYYEELERLANKLLILEKGKVVDYGDRMALFHKYCGHSVFVMDDTPETRRLTEQERTMLAPKGKIAVSSDGPEDEVRLSERLIRSDICFRRSICDIELLYVNAKGRALTDEEAAV